MCPLQSLRSLGHHSRESGRDSCSGNCLVVLLLLIAVVVIVMLVFELAARDKAD